MSQVCRNCSRPNPPDALYCYYDGFALGGRDISRTLPIQPGTQSFATPFLFPSGRTCRNFDELVRSAFELWEEARELLKDGSLVNFLGGLGRADLARLARQAMTPGADATGLAVSDRALDDFLGGLPGTARQPPQLHVEPVEINLGELARPARAGAPQPRTLTLHIENKGMALLHGSIASEETPWLVLGEPPGVPSKLFECRRDLSVPVQVLAERLRASAKMQEGKLVIESNGGSATIVVRAEAPVKPFSQGVLAGAITPRQIAEKARASPKFAAPLFESGAVAAWYESNGWVYPIQGDQAPGLAGVQQFFEALGLTTPPRVEVSELFVRLQGPPGVAVEHTLQVTAVENRPVYITATSTVSWLKVEKPVLAGRSASLRLVVPSVPSQPGESLLGRVQITANGNQRFTVAVSLAIAGFVPGARISPPARTPPGGLPALPPQADLPGIADPPRAQPPWPEPSERATGAPLAPTQPPGPLPPLARPDRMPREVGASEAGPASAPSPLPALTRPGSPPPPEEPLLSIPPGRVWVPPVRPVPPPQESGARGPRASGVQEPGGNLLGHLIPLGILILLLLGTVIHDILL